MPYSQGIKLSSNSGFAYSEKIPSRRCYTLVTPTSRPNKASRSITKMKNRLTICWSRRSRDAAVAARRAEEEHRPLLIEEKRPAWVPQHAASSFLTTASSRAIREANYMLWRERWPALFYDYTTICIHSICQISSVMMTLSRPRLQAPREIHWWLRDERCFAAAWNLPSKHSSHHFCVHVLHWHNTKNYPT